MAYDSEGLPRGTQNLLKLADILDEVARTLPPERYNQKVFGKEEECGTVACAMGWGALSGEFGYRYNANQPDVPFVIEGNRTRFSCCDIGEQIFGLTGEETAGMFGAGMSARAFYNVFDTHKITAKLAADRIRAFAISKIGAK